MTETPEATAHLLNKIVLAMDLMQEGKDNLLALQEFSLGFPSLNRDIDLCYGYAKVPAHTSTQAEYEVIIGQGISRITNGNTIAKLTEVDIDFKNLNITNDLPVGKIYQNVYVFGNIFLSQAPSGLDDFPVPVSSVSFDFLKGESTGTPIFMVKDIKIEDVIKMSMQDEIAEAQGPDEPHIKLFNVIVDINYFDPSNLSTKDVKFYFIDKRKPRGWGGFAEEYMGVFLTPYIINKNLDFDEFYDEFDQKIYNLVQTWMNLRFWYPSFLDFWNNPSNSDLMPERLKEYLELKFSVII